ncbi:Nn.00g102570.m01.CDS01 [Neocucurbitaria sp. VM-36]
MGLSKLFASCCGLGRSRDSIYDPVLADSEREAVADLLGFLENRAETDFFSGEPLRALSTLVYSDNIDLQRSASLTFAEITERDVREVDRDTLEPILFLLQNPDIEVQRAASAALGNLAVNTENKVAIVALGGLAPLIKQMNSPNVEVQCNAVGCITNLATHEDNKAKIARSGALQPLTRLAKSKDMRVQRNATGALLNMTHSDDNRQQLVNAGAIPVLVQLLSSPDVDVQYYCTTALSNIAVDASNRAKLAQTEGRLVGSLVHLMESSSPKVQCQAALALRNLASDERYQLEIVRARGLPSLLRLLQSSYLPLILSAVACIRNISIHPANESPIIEAGFLRPLVDLLGSTDNDEIQCHAISTLRNLAASSDKNKQLVLEAGAVQKCKQLVLNVRLPVQSEMTAAIAVLALSEELKPHLLNLGVFDVLIPLTESDSIEVQGNSAAALGNLSSKVGDYTIFIQNWTEPAGGIHGYLRRFLASGDPTFQHIAIWTLLQLLESEDSQLIEHIGKSNEIVQMVTEIAERNIESDDEDNEEGEGEVVTLAQPVIPKREDDDDAKPTVTRDDVSITIEAQASPSVAASAVASPQDGTASSTRPPVQRIGSLQGAIPPSRSASPSVRGRGTIRGKRGTPKPTFTGRRSKEEREAIAKEQKERDALRNAERDAALARKERDEANKAKREARNALRARGGYSGAVSGPFSLGSSREDRKGSSNRGTSGFGSGTGSRAVRIKHDGDTPAGPSHRSGGGSISIKREDGGYVSSSSEDDAEFPRKDIDLIEISSDENDATPDAAPKQRAARTALPVRIGRKEHQERTFGINTEASTEASAKILEQAEATGRAVAVTVSEQVSRKGKAKVKDVEITGVRKPFKGVWQDAQDPEVSVKTEVLSDDEDMADAEQVGVVEHQPQPMEKQEASSPPTERKPQARTRSIAEPVLQTDEDRAEWARFQSNLRHIRAELGPEEVPAVDVSGDVNMADAATNAKRTTVRDNNVYLFQIPPLMPELLPRYIKKELSEPQNHTAPVTAPAVKSEPKIKLEEGGFSDPSAKPSSGPRFASGHVGKLRVRQSGRTTLDWGGTSYELTPGNKASFLQEVVSINVVPEKDRVVPEDAGEAVSFGRVKGKFVVVPDWGSMLG